MIDILIRNAKLDGQMVDLEINNEKIVAITQKSTTQAKQVIDAKGGLVIPGFVDAHTHLDKALLNPASPYVDGTGPEKGKLTLARKKDFTVRDIYQRAEIMLKRAINSGTIAIRTNVDVDGVVGLKGIEALLQLKKDYAHLIQVQVTAFAQEGVFVDTQTQALLAQALQLGADLIGGHTIANGEGAKHIDVILQLAKTFQVEAEFHLDESGKREHYLLPYLTEQMVKLNLQSRVTGIHLCTLSALTEEELQNALKMIKDVQLKVTVAPTAISTRALAPVKKLVQQGTLVALGSDNLRDFFNPLGSANVRDVASLLGYVQRFYTAEEVKATFDMITTKGAESLGLKDYEIRQGGTANVVVLPTADIAEIMAYRDAPLAIIRRGQRIA
jgi:cytosine/creatinine deaminase